MDQEILLRTIMEGWVDGKRGRGRPRLLRLEDIDLLAVIESINPEIRSEWRRTVEEAKTLHGP